MKMRTQVTRWVLGWVSLFCVLPAVVTAQSLDGRWRGNLSCTENLRSSGPGYTTVFDIEMSGASGSGLRSDDRTNETFELKVMAGYRLHLQSEGRVHGNATTRWVLRLDGVMEGEDRMKLQGAMFAGDGGTLLRERCSASLQRSGAPAPILCPWFQHQNPTHLILLCLLCLLSGLRPLHRCWRRYCRRCPTTPGCVSEKCSRNPSPSPLHRPSLVQEGFREGRATRFICRKTG